jgi:hypothetical protein
MIETIRSAMVRPGFLVGLALLGLGCGRSVEDAAAQALSAELSCPVERIKVTRRPDLTEDALRARRHLKAPEVPAEMKDNPRIVAKYQELQEKHRKLFDEASTRPIDRKPPSEIAADPGRLALWKKKQAEEQALLDRRAQENPIAVAEGCGQKKLYVCSSSRKRSNYYSCSPSSYDP